MQTLKSLSNHLRQKERLNSKQTGRALVMFMLVATLCFAGINVSDRTCAAQTRVAPSSGRDGEPQVQATATISLADIGYTDSSPVHERKAELNGTRYVVTFQICQGCMVGVPATNPLGQPHYDAAIRIYIETGDDQHSERTLFYGPFNGEWIEKGCFEDDPKSLVERAMFEKAKKQPN